MQDNEHRQAEEWLRDRGRLNAAPNDRVHLIGGCGKWSMSRVNEPSWSGAAERAAVCSH